MVNIQIYCYCDVSNMKIYLLRFFLQLLFLNDEIISNNSLRFLSLLFEATSVDKSTISCGLTIKLSLMTLLLLSLTSLLLLLSSSLNLLIVFLTRLIFLTYSQYNPIFQYLSFVHISVFFRVIGRMEETYFDLLYFCIDHVFF